ncbi:MAG: hypothetical protein PHW52_02530 [Candidatus Pacebacteria bacterium]|nr:hypothetical protein [Candidatus Paceibacterota bacterium]
MFSIISYLFFALSSLGDKIVLAKAPKPATYVFYVGVFGFLALFLLLLFPIPMPGYTAFWLLLINGFTYIFSLYALFAALEKFDVSKVIPTVGATQPIFVFFLTWLYKGPQPLGVPEFIAYSLLFLGSIIISVEKNDKVTEEFISLSFLASFLFSLNFIFSKLIFLEFGKDSFVPGFFWMSIFAGIIVLLGLCIKSFRDNVFIKEKIEKKTGLIFLAAQGAGGVANVTQNLAIQMVPMGYLAIMNSLKGVQYVFLFLITLSFSIYFPKILKENFSKSAIIQKAISIIMIIIGLAILTTFV